MYVRQSLWAVSLWCICIFLIQPRSVEAMEWALLLMLLFVPIILVMKKLEIALSQFWQKHDITTEILYYIRQKGLVLPTDNKTKAEGFLVLVNVKNASLAKSILKRAIEDGLPISLLEKSILNPSK